MLSWGNFRKEEKAVRRFSYHKDKDMTVHLFVRRSKRVNAGSAPFLYCGPVEFKEWSGERPITVQWHLPVPVPQRFHALLKIPEV